jgi:hypothetical protein
MYHGNWIQEQKMKNVCSYLPCSCYWFKVDAKKEQLTTGDLYLICKDN